jgi:hypothetical protein
MQATTVPSTGTSKPSLGIKAQMTVARRRWMAPAVLLRLVTHRVSQSTRRATRCTGQSKFQLLQWLQLFLSLAASAASPLSVRHHHHHHHHIATVITHHHHRAPVVQLLPWVVVGVLWCDVHGSYLLTSAGRPTGSGVPPPDDAPTG